MHRYLEGCISGKECIDSYEIEISQNTVLYNHDLLLSIDLWFLWTPALNHLLRTRLTHSTALSAKG